MELAERISTLRRANGLSARQLAALVDVAPTTVTRIEAGVVSPSFDLAQEIFTVLGEPIGFIGSADRDAIATARLVLYVSDVPAAAEAAGITPRARGAYGGRITLIPFDGVCELGRIEIEGTTVVVLDQVILDCYGGTGRMSEQADLLGAQG